MFWEAKLKGGGRRITINLEAIVYVEEDPSFPHLCFVMLDGGKAVTIETAYEEIAAYLNEAYESDEGFLP